MIEPVAHVARLITIAAGYGDDHALARRQPARAVLAISEGLTGHYDAIDPGLKLGGNREIIHGRADHDDVGGLKLLEIGARLRIGSGQRGDREMVDRLVHQIARGDFDAGRFLADLFDDSGGQLSADRILSEDAGIEVKQFHKVISRYIYVTEDRYVTVTIACKEAQFCHPGTWM